MEDVSLSIREGETLGLAGESGCGKTTLARILLGLLPPTSGQVFFEGREITQKNGWTSALRRKIQIIFQDPFSSLNPRMRVGEIVGEPMVIHGLASGKALHRRVGTLLEKVGLDSRAAGRYPHEFSGGQRQRIGIARALTLSPRLIIADEPVSALDVSIQSQILNLLKDLQKEMRVAYLFIAHDLSVVKYISHRVAVMCQGRIVECEKTERLFESPSHPYTRRLLQSIPRLPKTKKGKNGGSH